MIRFILFTIMVIILGGCQQVTAEPEEECCGSEITVTREVIVFDDSNDDGIYNEDEQVIPDVLISWFHNVHGASERKINYTDQSGNVTFTETYTHDLNVTSTTPCGYAPTTSTYQDASDKETLLFGFKPIEPRQGQAVVRFYVWVDANQDGQHDPDELPLPHTQIHLGLSTDDTWGAEDYDEMSIITDDNGWGEFQMGNTCGTLFFSPRYILPWAIWDIVPNSPTLTQYEVEKTYEYEQSPTQYDYSFDYDLGETVIQIGVIPTSFAELNIERRTVYVFEDANENSQFDPGEKTLPNVPVIGSTHGGQLHEYDQVLTNEDGQAVIDAFYMDDNLHIEIVPPCGYRRTTPEWKDPTKESDPFYVGFTPEHPQPGQANVRLHLWQDQNGDGQQDIDDRPINDMTVWLSISDAQAYYFRWDDQTAIGRDDRLLVTDEEGWIELTLGNTCGQINVELTFHRLNVRWRGWSPFTFTHEPVEQVHEEYRDYFRFNYGIGETIIEIGFKQAS